MAWADDIREYMTLDPQRVTETEPLENAAWLMSKHHVRHLPVIGEGRRVVGIVEDAQVFGRGRLVGAAWETYDERDKLAVVADVMRPSPLVSRARTALVDVLRALAESQEEAVIVVDAEHRPIGIFTMHDAMRGAMAVLPHDIQAKDLGSAQVLGVSREQNVGAALDTMLAHRIRHLVVVYDGKPWAVVSFRNLVEIGADRRPSTPLRELRPGVVETVAPSTSVHQVVDRMIAQKVGCLPIVGDDGELVGIVTRTDVLRSIITALD